MAHHAGRVRRPSRPSPSPTGRTACGCRRTQATCCAGSPPPASPRRWPRARPGTLTCCDGWARRWATSAARWTSRSCSGRASTSSAARSAAGTSSTSPRTRCSPGCWRPPGSTACRARNVGASLKHFAVNSQETDRMRVSADVDERTLREMYLSAFRRVVTQARPWTVMCAYNKVNGVYASQHHWLLTEVLRDEWGYEGVVVSDWGAVADRVAAVAAGLDLTMPGPDDAGDGELAEAVAAGRLDPALLSRAAGRVRALVGQGRRPHAGRLRPGGAPRARPRDRRPRHRAAQERRPPRRRAGPAAARAPTAPGRSPSSASSPAPRATRAAAAPRSPRPGSTTRSPRSPPRRRRRCCSRPAT